MSWEIGGETLSSRLFLGTAQYPSPEILRKAIQSSQAEVLTLSLRREQNLENPRNSFWEFLSSLSVHILPNTAGCTSVKEAILTAQLAREIFKTNWLKLEIVRDHYLTAPDGPALIEATTILSREGFEIFPYTTDDIATCDRLVEAGCRILMPWGSPIGSARGIANPATFQILRERFPRIPLIVDAGIGRPSHAVQAMELGADGCLINSAVALASDPIAMASAFAKGIESGRLAFESGMLAPRLSARPSTPSLGQLKWGEKSV